jgi:hypothetical protein
MLFGAFQGATMRIRLFGAAVIATFLGLFSSANAEIFDWSLTGQFFFAGQNDFGGGTLTATNLGGGIYQVDTITGSVSYTCTGDPCEPIIHPIIKLLGAPEAILITGGTGKIGDNLVFFPTAPFVDTNGIMFAIPGCPFSVNGLCETDVAVGYSPQPFDLKEQYALYVSNFGAHPVNFVLTEEVTSAVPELSSWAMMLIGFAGIGFMAYRRQRKVLAAA